MAESTSAASESASNSVDRRVTIEEAFRHYDADNSGFLDARELRDLTEHLGQPLSGRELKLALRVLDQDGSGVIEKTEFLQWWASREDGAEADPAQQELQRTLRRLARRGRQQHHVDVHVAAWRGDLALVRQFLAADPGMASRRDETEVGDGYEPLHYAAYNGHDVVCDALLTAGADVNSRTDAGCSALFLAAQQHRLATVRLLLERGADVTLCDNEYSFSPLDVAATDCLDVFRPRCCLPGAPGVPRCSAITGGCATLEWDFTAERRRDGLWVAPPASFEVRVFRDGEVWGRLRTYFGTRNAKAEGLEEGASYAFAVRGITPLGKGPWSERSRPVQFAARAAPPALFRAAVITHDRLTLAWEEPVLGPGPPLTGYTVRVRQLNEHGIAVAPSSRVAVSDATHATLRNLEPGAHYRVSVACVTASGIGKSSRALVVRTDESVAAARRRLRQHPPEAHLLALHDPNWETTLGMRSIAQQQQQQGTPAREKRAVRIPGPAQADAGGGSASSSPGPSPGVAERRSRSVAGRRGRAGGEDLL